MLLKANFQIEEVTTEILEEMGLEEFALSESVLTEVRILPKQSMILDLSKLSSFYEEQGETRLLQKLTLLENLKICEQIRLNNEDHYYRINFDLENERVSWRFVQEERNASQLNGWREKIINHLDSIGENEKTKSYRLKTMFEKEEEKEFELLYAEYWAEMRQGMDEIAVDLLERVCQLKKKTELWIGGTKWKKN